MSYQADIIDCASVHDLSPPPSQPPPSLPASSIAQADNFDFYNSESDKIPIIVKNLLASHAAASDAADDTSTVRELCSRALSADKKAGARHPVPTKACGSSTNKKCKAVKTKKSKANPMKRARSKNIVESESESEVQDDEEDPEVVYEKILQSHKASATSKKKGQMTVWMTAGLFLHRSMKKTTAGINV
ncbi:hypothetical protein M422DRAFT_269803 [Sphaerobolus stellatus SS14]|uniref:Uncharacterized protein n=1 Tax=Sphaerobolus stellatus (strain SS14) TaxID=990650 RepID=A0A0C9UU48_SPHS4|nr:hypothetical protein M422DRAFT_269803 [Sphaerobolus stellatus SS14]